MSLQIRIITMNAVMVLMGEFTKQLICLLSSGWYPEIFVYKLRISYKNEVSFIIMGVACACAGATAPEKYPWDWEK